MEPGSSFPNSQEPDTCNYPKPYQFSPWPQSHCLKIHFNIVFLCVPRTSSGLFPSGFPTKTLLAPVLSLVRATNSVHLILLHFITRIILGEVYSLLQSPITPSLLGHSSSSGLYHQTHSAYFPPSM